MRDKICWQLRAFCQLSALKSSEEVREKFKCASHSAKAVKKSR